MHTAAAATARANRSAQATDRNRCSLIDGEDALCVCCEAGQVEEAAHLTTKVLSLVVVFVPRPKSTRDKPSTLLSRCCPSCPSCPSTFSEKERERERGRERVCTGGRTTAELAGAGNGELFKKSAGQAGHEGQHLDCKVKCSVPRQRPGGTRGTRGTALWFKGDALRTALSGRGTG
jgi:hypothetical protein